MKMDINDTLRAEGVDGVRARHDRAQKFNGAVFPAANYDALNRDFDIPLREVGTWNGQAPITPQSFQGKSFIHTAADLRTKQFAPLK
jgi:hypothetical protein